VNGQGGGSDGSSLLRELEASSLDEVRAAIRALDLGRLRWAVRSLPPDEVVAPDAVAVATSDFQLKAELRRLGESLADQGRLNDRLASQLDPMVVSVLLAPHGGPEPLIASYLVKDPELPPNTLAMIAGALEPRLKVEALRRLFDDLDADVDINLLINVLRGAPSGDVDEALLAARPRTVVGCEVQMALTAERLDRSRWIPHLESFLDLTEAWTAVMRAELPGQPGRQFTIVELLYGLARTWVDQEHWRASGVASLAQLTVAPNAEALGRAVFEASTIADWPLLQQVVDAAVWVEESIAPEDAENFFFFVTPTVARLRAHGDDSRANAVADLAEACAEAADGPLTQRSLELLGEMREATTGPPQVDGIRDVFAQETIYRAVWGYSQFGGDVHDVMPRVPAAEVLRVASQLGSARRQGPLCLLLLADLATEFGDLDRARDIVEQASQAYPDHSTVLAAQRKLASHTGDVLQADKALDALARLWAEERDGAGVHAQMGVLEELHATRGRRLAEMRAGQLLGDPRFHQFSHRLKQLRG
jgi:hypothetical protein